MQTAWFLVVVVVMAVVMAGVSCAGAGGGAPRNGGGGSVIAAGTGGAVDGTGGRGEDPGATGGGSLGSGGDGTSSGGRSAASGGSGSGGMMASMGGPGRGGAPGSGSGGSTANGGARGTGGGRGGGTQSQQAKFVGNITTSGQARGDFGMYWNQITPENEGKWGSVEATRNQMNWAGLDRVHDFAKQNKMKFKQHNFVWGSQQPSWLGALSQADQKAEVEEWIRLFCARYPDVDMIDVVNEPPPHTTPVYLNALGGAGASGYDWIVQSFKWARQYCPNAILILNDYNTIEYGPESAHFIDIVTRIKGAGAPIDALGAQAHDAYKLPNATVQGYLRALEATGLPIYISEYDIDLANDSQQQAVMQSQFTMFWNDPRIQGITLWGYVVGATWKPNTGLVTAAGMKRPALTWLMTFLGR